MVICVRRQANLSKQTTLLDGVDIGPPKWRVCGCGLNQSVHEGMDNNSNVEVHLLTLTLIKYFCVGLVREPRLGHSPKQQTLVFLTFCMLGNFSVMS